MWTYKQSTGEVLWHGSSCGFGYAGLGEGKNNPSMESVANVGPLPKNRYEIGTAFHSQRLGMVVMALIPHAGGEMFGRNGFFIHGDSVAHAGAASNGCIILSRNLRDAIACSGDHTLEVVE